MNKASFFQRIMLPSLAFMLVASLGVGCSGCNGSDADTAGDASNTEGVNAGGSSTDGAGADGTAGDANANDGHEGHDHGDGTMHSDNADGGAEAGITDKWTRVYATPVEERTGTVENLNGLRATLVAELEQVRGRLKDGTRAAADRKADSQRASELAQGLERLDRTIKQISDADDLTWNDMRASSLKSAGEFREWMVKYGMPS